MTSSRVFFHQDLGLDELAGPIAAPEQPSPLPIVHSSFFLSNTDLSTRQRRRAKQKDRSFSSASHGEDYLQEEEEFAGGAGNQHEEEELVLQSIWHCPECTCINAPDRRDCEACGHFNKQRGRLREKCELKRMVRLQQEREAQEKATEQMNDLEDLEEEDSSVVVIEDDKGEEEEEEGPPNFEMLKNKKVPLASPSVPPASVPSAPLLYSRPMSSNGITPFALLPADLLLHCLAFMRDVRVYLKLRSICKAWTVVAEHEALWKPLAEAHCRPVQAREKQHKTPSKSSPGGAALPARWSCEACGLLQADRFGLRCEFCQCQRQIIASPPQEGEGEGGGSSCFRVIKDYEELAEAWRGRGAGEGMGSSEGEGDRKLSATERPLYSEEKKRKADEAALMASSKIMSAEGENHERWFMAGTGKNNVWEVAGKTGAYYLLYKTYTIDKALSAKWDSLHRGYEWMINSSRVALRTRLYYSREQIMQRDDSLIPIPESFQKVVNKLSKRDWPLLWECMRAEFSIQAEALRRDILQHMRASYVKGMGVVRGYRTLLEDVVHLFEVYTHWVFEVSSFFMKMNSQISAERFQATTSSFAGCGVAENHTPYVSELALLGFRDHVVNNFMIRTPLLHAIEGDDNFPLAVFFFGGGGGGGGVIAAAPHVNLVEPEEVEVDRQVLASRRARSQRQDENENQRKRIVENLSDLLRPLAKMAEELDVMDGNPAGENNPRDTYRRLILLPLRDTLRESAAGSGDATGNDDLVGLLKEDDCGDGGIALDSRSCGFFHRRGRRSFRRLSGERGEHDNTVADKRMRFL